MLGYETDGRTVDGTAPARLLRGVVVPAVLTRACVRSVRLRGVRYSSRTRRNGFRWRAFEFEDDRDGRYYQAVGLDPFEY